MISQRRAAMPLSRSLSPSLASRYDPLLASDERSSLEELWNGDTYAPRVGGATAGRDRAEMVGRSMTPNVLRREAHIRRKQPTLRRGRVTGREVFALPGLMRCAHG
jgi:hypothetical protein